MRKFVASYDELGDILRSGTVGVLVADAADGGALLRAQLEPMRAAGVRVPVIGLVPALPRGFPASADAWVTYDCAEHDLVDAIRSSAIQFTLAAGADAWPCMSEGDSRADAALRSVLTQTPPFGSLDAVAERGRCSPDMIEDRWQYLVQHAPAEARSIRALKAGRFVAVTAALRALEAKRHNTTFDDAARGAHMSYETLRKLAQLFGHTLTALERDDPLHAVQWYERFVLERIGIELRWAPAAS